MERKINCGVSCGVSECRYNTDGMHCELEHLRLRTLHLLR